MKEAYETRDETLRGMGFSSYDEYRESRLWAWIRRQALRRDKKRCRICRGRAEEVHHNSYRLAVLQGRSLGDLFSLCSECHRRVEFEGGRKRSFEEARKAIFALLPRKESGARQRRKRS